MAFDKDTFLATHVEGAMETKFTPVPEADYKAYIDEIDGSEVGKGEEKQKVLNVSWKLVDVKPDVIELMGREDIIVKQTVFLDYSKDGRLEFGKNKNIALGALREAVGLNGPEPFSFRMLVGRGPCMLKINHRWNSTTGEGPFANVLRVAKVA